MAHFAEIRSSDNVILRVVVINDSDVTANGGEYSSESETWVANNIPNDLTLELDPYPEHIGSKLLTTLVTINTTHKMKTEFQFYLLIKLKQKDLDTLLI